MNARPRSMADPTPAPLPPFIVGIDLGTTNCAVAFIDTLNAPDQIQDFAIRQCTAPGIYETRDALPSYLYALLPEEQHDEDQLIDPHFRVGSHAQIQGTLAPGRSIASAKSWLCHGGVDRQAPILPWHASPDVPRLSPVDAQALILRHIRHCWDHAHPDAPLSAQDLYLTVPASFDEVARELTVEAARRAGLSNGLLLEEPQAAFYAWLATHETTWTDHLQPNDRLLICDVGGGTTDFTLIHALPPSENGIRLQRVAVGDHLILGGDNLDQALAHHVERKFDAAPLAASEWAALIRLCRHHKETLLGPAPPDSVQVVLPGSGSHLIRGQREVTLTREEVETLLVDGFLPRVPFDADPQRPQSGLRSFGLPYAADAAISKYLAAFLRQHADTDQASPHARPQAVLLNGGFFHSQALRNRFEQIFSDWYGTTAPAVWPNDRLDLAVARGAAYYGRVRRGSGVRVASDLGRAYFIGVESRMEPGIEQALCVAPADLDTHTPLTLDTYPLTVRLKRPVQFPLYVSSTRTGDRAGDLVSLEPERFRPLPSLRTILAVGKKAAQDTVRGVLRVQRNELGTLDLHIVDTQSPRSWQLAFDLRETRTHDASLPSRAPADVVDSERIDKASACLRELLSSAPADLERTSLLKACEDSLGLSRHQWPATALRQWWTVLMDGAAVRHRSPIHEARWLNAVGYVLRPGFGIALDDWRISECWKLWHDGPIHGRQDPVRMEWWICWRRLAGGLTPGQQQAIAAPLQAALNSLCQGRAKAPLLQRDVRLDHHEWVEVIRLLGNLEQFSANERAMLGARLLSVLGTATLRRPHQQAAIWALGRLGARVPSYGPINHVLPALTAEQWIDQLVAHPLPARDKTFALLHLARRTGDRFIDIGPACRQRVLDYLSASGASAHGLELVREGGSLDADEQDQLLGDRLPLGLVLER